MAETTIQNTQLAGSVENERVEKSPLSLHGAEDAILQKAGFSCPVEDESGTEQTDWEVAEHQLPKLPAQELKASEPPPPENVIVKQRGRGAFTYGERGMYSDCMDGMRSFDLNESSEVDPGTSDQLENRAGHVLVFKNASAGLKENDIEHLLKPYSSKGVTVRLVSDTVALAVFRSPAVAQEALASIQDPRFKVQMFSDASEVHAITSEKDLEPPVPRPATSVRAAQRMIAGALSAQGAGRYIRARGKTDAAEAQQQEAERRQRLQMRQQLRDEAWGDD